jgi:hypothetical protein
VHPAPYFPTGSFAYGTCTASVRSSMPSARCLLTPPVPDRARMIRDRDGTRRRVTRFAHRSVSRAGLSVRHEIRGRRIQAGPSRRRRWCRPFQCRHHQRVTGIRRIEADRDLQRWNASGQRVMPRLGT